MHGKTRPRQAPSTWRPLQVQHRWRKVLHICALCTSIASTDLVRTAPSLAESSVSSIQGGVGSGQGLSIEDRLNQWRLSRMQQQQQQPPVATIETTRPVLTRSRLENDSPNSSASSAASKRGIRPASGETIFPAFHNARTSDLHTATPSLSVAAKVPAPSRLPPPISATPRSGQYCKHHRYRACLMFFRSAAAAVSKTGGWR